MVSPGLDWVRRRQRALARGVLALFCLVWLQAALLPCAMAVVPGGMASAEEHCVYCPHGQSSGGETDTSPAPSCLYPDGAQADGRVLAVSLVAPLPAPIFCAAPVDTVAAADARPAYTTDAVPRPDYAVRYCRFLK